MSHPSASPPTRPRVSHSTLGVAAVTYGAGALNMVNPVAAAFAEKSPVVVISGAPGKGEASRGLLLHHQAKTLDSQFEIFRRSRATRHAWTMHCARREISRACCGAASRIRSRSTSSCRATW